jgi:predicted secreted hydrolase
MPHVVRLPRDEHRHDVDYEWWYAHGYLQNEVGHQWGFMFSFFKIKTAAAKRIQPSAGMYPSRQVYMLHLGLTDITRQRHTFAEHFFVPWLGHSGVSPFGLNVYFGPNRLTHIGKQRYELRMHSHGTTIHLHLFDQKGPVVHGQDGSVRVKSHGESLYYSQPRMIVEGSIENRGTQFVHGSAWLDHQWGDFVRRHPQLFWSWAGVQFNNGAELMLFDLFGEDGKTKYSKGTWFSPEGKRRVVSVSLRPTRSWQSSKSGVRYPTDFRVDVPALKLSFTMHADMQDQEMPSTYVTYWEGACSVIGKLAKKPITGKAYVELTGYDRLSERALRRRLPDGATAQS